MSEASGDEIWSEVVKKTGKTKEWGDPKHNEIIEHPNKHFNQGLNLGHWVRCDFGQVNVTIKVFEKVLLPINQSRFLKEFNFRKINKILEIGVIQDKYIEWYTLNQIDKFIEFKDDMGKQRFLHIRIVEQSKPDKIERVESQ